MNPDDLLLLVDMEKDPRDAYHDVLSEVHHRVYRCPACDGTGGTKWGDCHECKGGGCRADCLVCLNPFAVFDNLAWLMPPTFSDN